MQMAKVSPELQQLLSLSGQSHLEPHLIQSLKLQQNQLKNIPLDIGVLENLTELDLGRNEITSVPEGIGKLTKLTMLNLMENKIPQLPNAIGNLVQLKNLGLKSNKLTSLPSEIGNLTNLVGLFLTDNHLQSLPEEIGNLVSLKKLQCADNRLSTLPQSMQKMTSLELVRLAGNQFSTIPSSLLAIPRLSWTSLANNPLSDENVLHVDLPKISKDSPRVSIGFNSPLGAGASGKVYRSIFEDKDVAVKIFNGEVSPDGRSEDELSVAIVVDHPGIPKVLALLVDDAQHTIGTIMELVHGTSLADRPDFTSVLRCRYPPSISFSPAFVRNVCTDLAGACSYLHSLGICHGDVYAHNVLVTPEGHAKLCDFGASFFYSRASPYGSGFEKMEVQAYGLLVHDLSIRLAGEGEDVAKCKAVLDGIVELCRRPNYPERPTFQEIVNALQ
eukprot:Phypoly_transcript_09502.p1 GENE.Phypoly_transcript_09502~~Phypoly_transcript_09502.p1  ORF type:complete len:444 (+),score=53.84 Phypoly_transcript_09502:52-1383(+)